jgi:hypothetical protein
MLSHLIKITSRKYLRCKAGFSYRVLVENFGEGAVTLSENGLIVYTNGYFTTFSRYPMNE